MPESKPYILGRILEIQSNLSSGVLKEKSSAKGRYLKSVKIDFLFLMNL